MCWLYPFAAKCLKNPFHASSIRSSIPPSLRGLKPPTPCHWHTARPQDPLGPPPRPLGYTAVSVRLAFAVRLSLCLLLIPSPSPPPRLYLNSTRHTSPTSWKTSLKN